MFCPSCGCRKLQKFPNNTPVADLFCPDCSEQFELKSTKSRFRGKVVDGAYATMTRRITSDENPSFFFLQFDAAKLAVSSLFVVPKHFFSPNIIERRKPLAETARRAGWTGCNILLDRIPEFGRIHLVQDGTAAAIENVTARWRSTLFLREENASSRGWLLSVLNCIERIESLEFKIEDVYAFENQLTRQYPNNNNVRPKIRQQLQVLRDHGQIEFVGRGAYRKLK